MASIAGGLAAMGFKPYIHSFGPFASRRCFDQIFISAAYAKNAVTVIGSDPGVTATMNGGTHMPFEDVALYSVIPGSTIIDISDCVMLKNVLPQLKELPGVKYIRVPRKVGYQFYEEGSDFEIGKAIELTHGGDVVIFAAGSVMLHEAMQAAALLKEEGISASVVDLFTIKPLDEEAILRYVGETGCAVVAENHNVRGGLCSAVSQVVAQQKPVPMEYVAVMESFGEVGTVEYLQERFGLTAAEIVKKAKKAINRKKEMLL